MATVGERTKTVSDGIVTLHHHYKCDLCGEVVDVPESYPEVERMPFHLKTGWPGPPSGWISLRQLNSGDDYWAPRGPIYCSWACAAGVAVQRVEDER